MTTERGGAAFRNPYGLSTMRRAVGTEKKRENKQGHTLYALVGDI